MKITRVKLNPEQAVLSCCDNNVRAEITGKQCFDTCPDAAGGFFTVNS